MNQQGKKQKRKKGIVGARDVSVAMSALGRIGGLARAQKMSSEERRASALKASKAAAEARRKKAAERKRPSE
jgi:hypothetical protein